MGETLTVIGNDEAAIEVVGLASNTGRSVVWIQSERYHSSWILSQALRHLVGNLLSENSADRRNQLYRLGSPGLLRRLISSALSHELQDLRNLVEKFGACVLTGEPRFDSAGHLHLPGGVSSHPAFSTRGPRVVATGARYTSLSDHSDTSTMMSIEQLFAGHVLPQNVCILGGDGVGAGIAALLNLFGRQCSLITTGSHDDALTEMAIDAGVSVTDYSAHMLLAGKNFGQATSAIIDCRRKVGSTSHLALENIGVEPDDQGQLWCSDVLETWCPGIYGAGAVVGFSPVPSDNATKHALLILSHLDGARRRRSGIRPERVVVH